MASNQFLDISWATIFKIAVALLSFYLIFLIRDVLLLVIFALIISILLNPAIDFLQKRKVPRVLAVISVYVGVFGFLGLLIYLIVPVFVSEIQRFSQLFPQYFEKVSPFLKNLGLGAFENLDVFIKSLGDLLIKASSNILSALSIVFGSIFSTFTIFIIALFLSLEEKAIERVIGALSPKKHEAYLLDLWHRARGKVAGWFGSRIFASLLVGGATYLACRILAIDYAVSFASLAAVFNIVPIIGPFITALIIFAFTVLDSWSKAIFILIAFTLIQQLEGNVLTPILTKKFVGIPAVLVLVALLIGGKLWGVMGAILSIPLAGVIFEFLRDYLKKRKEENSVVL